MQTSNGSSISAWMGSTTVPEFPQLDGDTSADVCVIGAGIAGLTSAMLLLKEGKSVIVIDAIGVGAGETGRTTAHFFPPDERYFEIERRFGSPKAALLADSYRKATDWVEATVHAEGIDCEFERLEGYLFTPHAQWDDVLEREFLVTTRLGLGTRRLERVPLLPFDTGPCVGFPHQAQFHPLKYLAGLARSITRMGGRICGRTRAIDLAASGAQTVVDTEHGRITASAVVVATNTPFNDRVVMHTKQAAYRTYVAGFRVPRGALPRVLLWDTGDPYYYVRLASIPGSMNEELLIVGGRDHKVGQDSHPQHRYDEIDSWTRARFPMAGATDFTWSGEIMEPADGVAYLGRNPSGPDNVYIITGDSGNGMTHCTAGAMLVTDLVAGRDSSWSELYAPSRKPVHGVSDFITEQANTLSQYTDWLRGGDVDSVAEIARGEGALVRDGGRLLAVHRGGDGELSVMSAACTHLGCAVHWNSAEKSWDCPCHGSRFGTDGSVLHGPAKRSLTAATLHDAEAPAAAQPGAAHEDRQR